MFKPDVEFLEALLRSATFWRETVWLFAVALVLLAALFLAMRRWRPRRRGSLHADTRGAAAAVDFILTIPIVFAVVFLIVQFALMAHASLIVHYAAYASARSARVWYWDYDTAFIDGVVSTAGLDPALLRNQFARRLLANDDETKEKALFAAGFALIPVAPGSYPAGAANNTLLDNETRRVIREIATRLSNDNTEVPGSTGQVDRTSVLMRKAAYSFSPRNTDVQVHPVNPDIPDQLIDVADSAATALEAFSEGIAWQVQADVEFRYPLVIPFASRLFGTWQGEGFYARQLYAEVRLL